MKRLTKTDVSKMYGVNRRTVGKWIREYGLPCFQVSPHLTYVREEDLLRWENELLEGKKYNLTREGL